MVQSLPSRISPDLRHATRLIALEVAEAREEKRKEGDRLRLFRGRLPSPYPRWRNRSSCSNPNRFRREKLTLYKLDVKGNSREVFFFDNPKKRKDSARPLGLMVTRLAPGLSKLEANETLFPGEYALTPEGSNQVFLFQVF
jgi:hypothetical protein